MEEGWKEGDGGEGRIEVRVEGEWIVRRGSVLSMCFAMSVF